MKDGGKGKGRTWGRLGFIWGPAARRHCSGQEPVDRPGGGRQAHLAPRHLHRKSRLPGWEIRGGAPSASLTHPKEEPAASHPAQTIQDFSGVESAQGIPDSVPRRAGPSLHSPVSEHFLKSGGRARPAGLRGWAST